MEARKRGVDHLRAFAGDVQQNEASISLELVDTKGVFRAVSPRAMGKLVEIRVGRDEEKLLVDEFFISLNEVRVSTSSEGLARGRVAVARGLKNVD
jgi:hypothetical protein